VPPRDWSSEFLQSVKPLEEKADATRKESEKQIPGTKPSLELAQYAGHYVNCVMGDVHIVSEGAGLAWQGVAFAGLLNHWHYDTFQVNWTDLRAGSAQRKSLVTFQLNARGRVSEATIEGIKFQRAPEGASADWKPEACR